MTYFNIFVRQILNVLFYQKCGQNKKNNIQQRKIPKQTNKRKQTEHVAKEKITITWQYTKVQTTLVNSIQPLVNNGTSSDEKGK